MKKSLLIFILLLSSIAAFAQQTISGVVTDEQTKESLPFANIFKKLLLFVFLTLDTKRLRFL